MEKTAGAALIVIGVVALFAAIVGGGLKVRDIEVGSVPSRVRQGLLAIFGLAIGITGLALIWDEDDQSSTAPTAANTEAVADLNGADANSSDANETDANVTGANPADTNTADNGTDTNTDTPPS